MIAIDSNVLLRRLLNDDATQSEKARKLFQKAAQILITDIVLVETVWTLTGKRYAISKEEICEVIMRLLEEPNVIFESQQAVWSALNDYAYAKSIKTASGMRTVGFADALVVNKAKALMEQWGESYECTYTFDQAAQTVSGARAL